MAYSYPFRDVDDQLKLAVWKKGTPIQGFEATQWRRDICGRAMLYSAHGDTNSEYGWEIDHIKPASKNGPSTIDNLQPLYWENNRRKGDAYPWSCA